MKKKLFKTLALVSAVTMAAATFSACGGAKVKKIDEKALDGYTFRVSAYRDFSNDPLNMGYADGANKFLERYPQAKVDYLSVSDGATSDIAAAIAAGDVWDIQYVFTCSRLPGSIVDGLYEPIDGYFNPDDERLDAGAMRNGYFDGHYYGIANSTMNELNYFSYNENMFKENGIKTPHEYYAEGNWNLDAYMEICKQLDEKDIMVNMGNFWRPDWILNRATKWNDDFTEVEIILDSNETRQDLDKFKTIIYDYKLDAATGSVAKREVALSCDVVPNIIKSNNTTETTDSIRYIYIPSSNPERSGPHGFFTDAAFLTPAGSNLDVKPAAVELAICMGEGRKAYLDNYYKTMLNEEDYEILLKTFENSVPVSRGFSRFTYGSFQFAAQMNTGKSVSTYVSEITDQLKTHAETFNEQIEAYRAETGLTGEDAQ